MDDGKASPETCRQDSAERLALAQTQLFLAKVEHRRKAGDEVKAPLFDFAKVCHELRGDLAVRADERVASESKSSSERSLRSMRFA